MDATSSAARVAAHSLLTLLADGGSRHDALSLLHQQALQVTGGTSSLLFEQHPASGLLQATSGSGIEALPTEAWRPRGDEGAFISESFITRRAAAITDLATTMPLLHDRLGAERAILLPLLRDTERVGLLVIGLPPAALLDVADLEQSDVPAGFLLALELARLRQREDFEHDVRTLLDAFAVRLSSSLDLAGALEPLCAAATQLFAADRTTVWMYERESRSLVPLASSDPGYATSADVVRADDPLEPAATALRTLRAGLASRRSEATSVITVPLRGCRRALGTLVFEGVRIEAGDDIALLNRADELGRQLSSAIETMQLLDVVLKSRQARDRLVQSEKLAALGHFVSGIAHELNSPLQSVLGRLELLRTSGAVPEAIRHDIRTIYREADGAARIVRSLLVFAGSGRVQRRKAAVNGILQKVLALRKASCQSRQIEVVRNYDQDLPQVQADPLLLHQVFLNILINAEQAIAATGKPGRIEIQTGSAENGWLVVTVRDSGAGIGDDTLPRIFEPFYTTRDVGQGTGLGLSIAYGIVRDHGGRISAGNHPDGGAVFTVELPIA
jgi:signal transduction histidine kinase